MHKVIRKRIRRNENGVNLVADIDAVIAVNTGGDAKRSQTVSHSSHVVAQGPTARRNAPETAPAESNDPPKETP
jgi:hypothetical protein